MKKEGTVLLLLLAMGVGTLACGKDQAQTGPATEISSESETAVPDVPSDLKDTEGTTEFYLSTEETDALEEKYRAVVTDIQKKVASRNMEEIAEDVAFPCYVGIENVMVVQNKDEFMQLDPKQVFPDTLVDIIENTDADSLELYDAGYIISGESGKPNITIGFGEDGNVGITGFNY